MSQPPTPRTRPTSGLSRAQLSLLASLCRYHRHVTEKGTEWKRLRLHNFGVPLLWLRGHGRDRSSADSAAFSRTLLRLERRGLIVRSSHITGPDEGPRRGLTRRLAEEAPPPRTDHVHITQQGLDFCKRLT